MLEVIMKTIEKFNMLEENDSVVVGLSGGPDSVCLLHALYCLKDRLGIKLYAVHINHMIRGLEADADEAYAESFAKSLDVPFRSKRIKVEEYAKEHGLSVEEAGRYLRYNFFDEVAKDVGATKIALAHNMNDQAETMLMYFLRGSGIKGLGGIQPVREDRYIRPIIDVKREQIEEYCQIHKLSPVTDKTNLKSIYTRNRIRLELIPYIQEHFNNNLIETLHKNSEIFREEEEYLEKMALEMIKKIKKDNGFEIEKFNSLEAALKRRVIRCVIKDASGNLRNIEQKHVDECIELIKNGKTGRSINLPQNIICLVEYNVFKILIKREEVNFEYNLPLNGNVFINALLLNVTTRLYNDERLENFIDNMFIKYYDYDKIGCDLKIRNRRNGDYIYPRGMQGKKKLKDIFIDQKISREQRDLIPLLALEDEILWIYGNRDTRKYKIDAETKNILEIKFTKVEG